MASKRSADAMESASKKQKMPAGELTYMTGFGGHLCSEALKDALPSPQNSPQVCPYGLYAEQLSGTAFTVPRAHNQRSWLYRIRPAVLHGALVPVPDHPLAFDFSSGVVDPNQLRWQPFHLPETETDFLAGIRPIGGAGDACTKAGIAVFVYTCNVSMDHSCLYNSDGDFLIVPQQGTLVVHTEMGILEVAPREIVVVPRGMRFRVDVSEASRGYILEVYDGHFQIPDLGPIGSNGLANPRDFLHPVAAYEDVEEPYAVYNKFGGKMFVAPMKHSPFDVVAWHGDYVPYKYDLGKFNCMNSVTYDHPDPSIYTVLTCQTNSPGVAAADFVIFPPRWMVMEDTFRPPYYHRNCMTEFMGMIYGNYDAKVGFQPGGASLHSCMTAHGPDNATFAGASTAKLEPFKFDTGLAFMFESTYTLKLAPWAMTEAPLDTDYRDCWAQLPRVFDPSNPSTADAKKRIEAVKAANGSGAP